MPDFEPYRAYLTRIAQIQFGDQDLAAELVQETLLAALEGYDRFSGKSSVKTWLTGILKHKVIDAIRRRQREPSLSRLTAGLDEELAYDDFDALFQPDGHWDEPPSPWDNPDDALERKQFRDVLDLCLRGLPKNTARVFVLREVLECSNEEICKELEITATNAWVLLYRARMALKLCLQQHWFGR